MARETNDWSLSSFSDAMKEQSERREQQRKEWEAKLDEPIWFIPDECSEGHGIGYFKDGDVILRIVKYSNGYDKNSVIRYERDFIEKLYGLFNP